MECSRVLEKIVLLHSIAASEWFTPFQPGKVVNNIFSFLALFNHKQDEVDACRQDVCQILEQKLAKQGMAAVRLFLKNSFEFIIKSVLARWCTTMALNDRLLAPFLRCRHQAVGLVCCTLPYNLWGTLTLLLPKMNLTIKPRKLLNPELSNEI